MAEIPTHAHAIAARVEAFVRDHVVPYERESRLGPHGPSEALVAELRDAARAAGVMTPHGFWQESICALTAYR